MGRREGRVLPPLPESAGAARRFLTEVLDQWRLQVHLDTATLLMSELVANAVLHGATPVVVEVSVDLDRSELLVAVTDFGSRPVLSPVARVGLRSLLVEPDLDAESGRGLVIVATLADRWGIDRDPPGKTVWFALSLKSRVPISRQMT